MSDPVSARLFGAGSPATGEPAQLTLIGDQMAVRSAYTTYTVAIDCMRLRAVGMDESGLEFSWDTPEGVKAVQVLDVRTVGALQSEPALAHCRQLQNLRSHQQRTALKRVVGWAAVVLFLLLPVLVLLLFLWQADRIAMAAAARIPIEREVQLGEQVFEEMSRGLTLLTSGPAYAMVQALGAPLVRESKYSFKFHVAQNDAVNAFALPGGIIVVHTGLIEATRRPEELAGVLAHEIQHIEQRHSLQAIIKDLGLRGLWILLTGDVGSGVLGQAALEITALTFSRDAEEQADARAFDLLVANRVDPSGMADFFHILAEESGSIPPALLSTHPPSQERERRLRNRLREVRGIKFEPLSMERWPPQ